MKEVKRELTDKERIERLEGNLLLLVGAIHLDGTIRSRGALSMLDMINRNLALPYVFEPAKVDEIETV